MKQLWELLFPPLSKRIQQGEQKLAVVQADLDALKAEADQAKVDFDNFVARVAAKVTDLQNQISAIPSLDGSGVQTSLDALKADIDAATV